MHLIDYASFSGFFDLQEIPEMYWYYASIVREMVRVSETPDGPQAPFEFKKLLLGTNRNNGRVHDLHKHSSGVWIGGLPGLPRDLYLREGDFQVLLLADIEEYLNKQVSKETILLGLTRESKRHAHSGVSYHIEPLKAAAILRGLPVGGHYHHDGIAYSMFWLIHESTCGGKTEAWRPYLDRVFDVNALTALSKWGLVLDSIESRVRLQKMPDSEFRDLLTDVFGE